MEGAGIVSALGHGVTGLEKGERVAYAMHPGSYAGVQRCSFLEAGKATCRCRF